MAHERPANGPSLALLDLVPSLLLQKISRRLRQQTMQRSPATRPSRPVSQSSLDSDTPPPSYQSNADDTESTDDRFATFRPFPSSAAPSRPSTSGSTTPTNSPPIESKSGIHWRYADTGFALLSLAAQEENNPSSLSTRLPRREYIDGVACMLRGLPTELTEEEELSLIEALPASVRRTSVSGEEVAVRRDMRVGFRRRDTPLGRQSTLHHFVAGFTLYLFLAMSFILPYLQLLLRQAYQFDRKHKISDRMLAQSVIAADAMGKRAITMTTSICAMNDGKVGDSMKEIGLYLVQGFSGGVYDGLGEGMQVLGLRTGDASTSRSTAPLQQR